MDDKRHKAFREDSRFGLDEFIFWIRSRRILPFIGKGNITVADFGSGFDALFLCRLLSRQVDAHGVAVDLSLDPALASKRMSLVVADLNGALPLTSESVDVATSLAVLEHLAQPQVHISELHRVLRSGGTLLLTTPAPASKCILEFIAYKLHIIDEGEIRDHKHYFNKEELYTLLEKAGFARDCISYRPFLFHLNQLVVATKV